MEADKALKIECSRCKGTGMTSHVVVYCGVPGTCYKCDGEGKVYKDPFYRAYGVNKVYYGLTMTTRYGHGNPNDGVRKLLVGKLPSANDVGYEVTPGVEYSSDRYSRFKYTEISESDARRFFKAHKGEVRLPLPKAA